MTENGDKQLDVRGVCCPLPLIQLAKAIKELKKGQTLKVTGNDPIFESSIRDYCQANGHEVLAVESEETQGVSILIRMGDQA